MRAMGFSGEMDAVAKGKCPMCNKKIDVTKFNDSLSRKEYKISGLCQECQDYAFPNHKSIDEVNEAETVTGLKKKIR